MYMYMYMYIHAVYIYISIYVCVYIVSWAELGFPVALSTVKRHLSDARGDFRAAVRSIDHETELIRAARTEVRTGALRHAWPDPALSVEPAMARMLAAVGGLDSSEIACWGGASSGDECGGARQVGTASHVNRGRSFV